MGAQIELFGRVYQGWLVLTVAVAFALTMVVLRVVVETWRTNRSLRQRDSGG